MSEKLADMIKEAELILEKAHKAYLDSLQVVMRLKVQRDIVFLSGGMSYKKFDESEGRTSCLCTGQPTDAYCPIHGAHT